MSRLTSAGICTAVAIAVAIGGTGAQGKVSRCDSRVTVYSYVEGLLAFNSNPAVCEADRIEGEQDGPVDGRLINPGTDSLRIIYTGEVKGDPMLIRGVLRGLGLGVKRIYLERIDTDRYESGFIRLPDDTSSSGCLNVTVKHVKKITKERRDGSTKTIRRVVFRDKTLWHTWDWKPFCGAA